MSDPYADHHPRSISEQAQRLGIPGLLADWNDENWLQFSMWHLYQLQAYLIRMTAAEETP